MKRMINLLLLALCLLLAAPVAAEEVWEKQLGEKITAVATDERGDRIFVGTESGQLIAYDRNGNVLWQRQMPTNRLSPAVGEISVSSSGHRIAVGPPQTKGMWVRFFDDAGAALKFQDSSSRYHRTASLSRDGDAALMLWSQEYSRILFGPSLDWVYHLGTIGAVDGVIAGDSSWVVYQTSTNTLNLYALNPSLIPSWYVGGYSPWRNRAAHTISGSTDGALTDYPVEITVIRGSGTSSGNTLYAPECRADFGDIRFTASDGKTLLPYYLKTVSGSTATFIFKIPEIPASPETTTIYVYWGNPSASSQSNLAALSGCYWYDDFEDGTIDSSIWTVSTAGGGVASEENGYLKLYGSTATGSRANLYGPALTGPGGWQISATVSYHDTTTSPYEVWHPGIDGTHLRLTSKYSMPLKYEWGGANTGYAPDTSTAQPLILTWTPGGTTTLKYGSDTLTGGAGASSVPVYFSAGDSSNARGHIHIHDIIISRWTPNPPTHGAWGKRESVVTPLDTKTLDGTITNIDAPETGDWVAVSTTTKTYLIQVTETGFGTVYTADRTGTPYQIQVADGGSFAIEGRNILADIFRIDAVQVGTYTTGGPVQHVAIAQKNGLYAAAGSDDGKYYVFSKDASSNWYLLHASDSYDPVTALAMSWRGEVLIIGRADGRLTAFQVSEQDATGTIKLNVFKANKPYAAAPLRIEHGGTNQEWSAPITVTTDDYGVAVVPVQWGHYLRITVGDDELSRVLVATPSQAEYVIYIPTDLPLRAGANYRSWYDSVSSRLYYSYFDTRGKTHVATFEIIRNSDNEVVHTETFTIPDGDTSMYTGYYQIPPGFTNTSYRIHLTATGSPSFSNTWHQWISGESGVASLPVELSDTLKTGMFMVLLLFIGGIFSYFSGPHGAVVVSLVAAMLVFWGWLPISPAVIVLCVVWAFLGLLGRTSVG